MIHVVNPAILFDRFAQGDALPRWGEVKRLPLIINHGCAVDLHTRMRNHALGQVCHMRIINVRLVELNLGEFGVVLKAHALVAEVTPNFIDGINPPHQQSLEVQLKADAQVQILLELVVMRGEGTGSCPAI